MEKLKENCNVLSQSKENLMKANELQRKSGEIIEKLKETAIS